MGIIKKKKKNFFLLTILMTTAGHRKITAIAAFATKNRPQRLTKSAPGNCNKQKKFVH